MRYLVFLWMFLVCGPSLAGPPEFAPVRPGTSLSFPRDFGAHPEFHTEWCYVTGWV